MTNAFSAIRPAQTFPFDPKTGQEKHGVSLKLTEDELFFARQVSGGNTTSGIRAIIQDAMRRQDEHEKGAARN